MKQIEGLIKIPLLLQPVWFIIEEKIWVESVVKILWKEGILHTGPMDVVKVLFKMLGI